MLPSSRPLRRWPCRRRLQLRKRIHPRKTPTRRPNHPRRRRRILHYIPSNILLLRAKLEIYTLWHVCILNHTFHGTFGYTGKSQVFVCKQAI